MNQPSTLTSSRQFSGFKDKASKSSILMLKSSSPMKDFERPLSSARQRLFGTKQSVSSFSSGAERRFTISKVGAYCGQANEFDRPHGQGVLEFFNGDKYKGGFLNGVMHGKGKFEDKNGNYYEGEYSHGEKHGKGREQFTATRQLFPAPFKKKRMGGVGNGKMTRLEKDDHQKSIMERKRDERRKPTFDRSRTINIKIINSSVTYVGSFKHGRREGYGRCCRRFKTSL